MSDGIDDLQRGETAEYENEVRYPFWGSTASDGFAGYDREVRELTAENIRIEGDKGNEEIVFDVRGTVEGVDPDEMPVFQTAERYERLQQYGSGPRERGWLARVLPVAITSTIVVGVALLATRLLAYPDMTINGKAVTAPPLADMVPAVVLVLAAAFAMQYAIGKAAERRWGGQ